MKTLFERKIIFFAGIWLILMPALIVSAQTRGVGVKVKQINNQVKEEILYRSSYALLIGNSNYSEWNNLPGVERDISLVEAVLRDKHGFTVEKALNLSKTELLARIDEFISKYGQSFENRLLIYYAGHGYTAVLPDGRTMGYLVMKNAPAVPPVEDALLKTPPNLGEFRLRAISMSEIENLANEISTRHAIFVFDSCFSGTVLYRDNAVQIPKEISSEELEQMRGFLTAGNERQRVRDDSPFRRAFIKGLEGKADLDGDGYILSTELGLFVKREVNLETRNSASPQTPIFGKPEKFSRGDMVFVVPKPGETNNIAKAASLANEAFDEILRGNFPTAKYLAAEALRLNNDLPLALAVSGWAKYNLSDYQAARTDLEKAVKLEPQNVLFLARLIFVYKYLSLKDLAEKTANEVLRLINLPKNALEYYARGLSNDYLEKTDKAIQDYTKAIELNPKFALAYFVLGNTYYNKQEYDSAIRDYTKAIELNPQFALAYFIRGNIYYNTKEYDSAIRDYTKAIELNPQLASAYANRGNVYINKQQYDSAIRDCTKAIELNPRLEYAYNDRGSLYHNNRQDYERAIRDFTKAIELNPRFALAYSNRASSYEAIGKKDLAAADRRKYEELTRNKR